MVVQSKDHYNYSTHKVFDIFTSHCLVSATNNGDSSISMLIASAKCLTTYSTEIQWLFPMVLII
jgi:hypothetical protein